MKNSKPSKAEEQKNPFNIFHFINEAILKISNDQIQILTLHFLQLRPIQNTIKYAKNQINEQTVIRLYDSSDSTWFNLSWSSFYDQLDKFYEECLHNKFERWNVHYFYVERLTINEFNTFEKSFQNRVERRFTRRFERREQQLQQRLLEFEEKAPKKNWNSKGLKKKFKESQDRSNQSRQRTSEFAEFLDHQLFHGSRITTDWNFVKEDTRQISYQIDQFSRNNWPYKSPYAMHLKILHISKYSKSKVRDNIISDIRKQLKSKKKRH